MAKYKLGLVNMLMGDIAADGSAGLVLTAIGDTVAGTAKMDTTEASKTDFKIEESDSPVLSVKTEADTITVSWSTYANNADTLVKMFGGTKVAAATGGILTFGTITGGSSYVNGTYNGVPLTGGTGSGATADITVSGGAVTAVAIRNAGSGYAAAASLSALAANLGGAGSGFSVVISTVGAVGETWKAPDSIPEIEQTLKIEMKIGGYVLIPRAKIVAKLSMSYKRDTLSQIDITATVLQPTKSGEPRLTIVNAD